MSTTLKLSGQTQEPETVRDNFNKIKEFLDTVVGGGVVVDGTTITGSGVTGDPLVGHDTSPTPDLQDVSNVGSITNKKITAANLNISEIPQFANNTDAITGGLISGDVYQLPVVSDVYGLAVVYGPGLTFDFTGAYNLQVSIQATIGNNIDALINWGDGNIESFNSASSHTFLHNYAGVNATRSIFVFVKNASLTYSLSVFTGGLVTQSTVKNIIYKIADMPSLFAFGINGTTNLDGFDPPAGLPNIAVLDLSNTALTVFNPSVALPSTLTTLILTSNTITAGLTGLTHDLPLGLNSIGINHNGLDVTAVNNTLIYLDTLAFTSPGTIYIAQDVAALPTGAGATASASLVTKGWTIDTTT